MITALATKLHGIEVTVLETSSYDLPRAGEHLVSQGLCALETLGVPAVIWEENSITCNEVQSTWGSDDIHIRDSILDPYGEGLLLTRPGFDLDLAKFISDLGVDFRFKSHVSSLERDWDAWRVRYKNEFGNNELIADYVVDASGRNTKFSPIFDICKNKYDRLIAITSVIQAKAIDHCVTPGKIIIEPSFFGWVYVAALKNNSLIFSLMTDSNEANKYGAIKNAFQELFPSTKIGADLKSKGLKVDEIVVYSCQTQIQSRIVGDEWMLVGDSAWSADPLSSQGMLKAIRTGIQAAKALDGYQRKKASELEVYENTIRKDFFKYLSERTKYYRMEDRWKEHEFWRNRHKKNWIESSVTLHPMRKINVNDDIGSTVIRNVKDIVPSIDVDLLVKSLSNSVKACDAVNYYKENMHHSITDKEIIVALQEMVG